MNSSINNADKEVKDSHILSKKIDKYSLSLLY